MSEFPNRRAFAVLALVSVAFVMYGSLVPFNFAAISGDQARAGLERFLAMDGLIVSRSDLVTNVALLVPFGFALMGALTLNRPIGALPVLATLVLGTLVAFGAEVAQVFFPGRNPSLADVYAQWIGNLAGIVVWCLIGPSLSEWLQRLHADRDGAKRATGILALLVGGLVIADLLPLDLTVRPAEIAAKYREGRILLQPDFSTALTLAAAGDRLLDVVSRVPFGMLALIGWTRRGRRRDAATAIVLGWLGMAAVEAAQVMVVSRVSDVMDLLTGALGVAVGALAASVLWPHDDGRRTASRAPLAIMGVAAWAACLAVYHWSPFDFTVDAAFARQRLPDLLSIPFASYAAVPPMALLRDVLAKAVLSLVLGALLRLSLPVRGGRTSSAWTVIAFTFAAWLLAIFEVGQLLLPARHADMTDVIVGLMAVAVGFVIAGRVATSPQPATRSPQLETRNPQPATPDPQPGFSHFRPRERRA